MAATGGFGVVWKISVGTGFATLTAVANVKEIEFPIRENVLADVTAHDSSSGAAEFVATGLKAPAEFSATLVWDPDNETTHSTLVTLVGSGATNAMTITDGGSQEQLSFSGIVKSIKPESAMDDAVLATVVVQVTGAITVT